MVGMSGVAAERLIEVTPSARTRPDVMCATNPPMAVKLTCTSPAINALLACPPLLYGTWIMSTPVMCLNNSAVR